MLKSTINRSILWNLFLLTSRCVSKLVAMTSMSLRHFHPVPTSPYSSDCSRPLETSQPRIVPQSSDTPHHHLLLTTAMSKVQLLTLSSLTGLVNSRGIYNVGYSFAFGMCTCAQL